jgi:anaerobic selenocysteine-containing dehydrogenase
MSRTTIKTICFDCHSRCGVIIEVEDNKIVNIKGDKEHPISRGHICMKGLAADEIINHPDRILYPLKRIGKKGEGKFERISWDEALDTISNRLLEYREQFGAESVAISGGTTRGMPPWIMPFLSKFGSPNFSPTVNYSLGPILMGLVAVSGSGAMADPAQSKCIILWGHNPEQSFPGLMMQEINEGLKSGAKLIVVDPRGIPLAKKADHWLPVRPGTDVALLLCFINIIIKNELYDRNFVEKWTFGFEELREHVSKYTPEYCSEITWIPADQIEKSALTFGKTKPACIMPGIGGACHSINSFDLARSIAILIAITGNYEVPGGHITKVPPTGARNCYGTDYSVTRNLKPKQIRKQLGTKRYPFYQFVNIIPPEPIYKAILEEKPYPVKAVGFFGHNPMCALGNSQYIKKGLEALDFLFIAEYFHTPTTKMADIVLPAAHWTERDDVEDLGMNNYVFCQPKALEPIPECKSEKQIFIDLAKRMDLNDYWKTIEESLNYRLEPVGVTFEELKKLGNVSIPIKYKNYEDNGGFPTPTKKIMLYAKHLEPLGIAPLPDHKEPPESPVSTPELWKEYPLILTTGNRILPFYHSAFRNIPSLYKHAPDPELQIHPETAKELGMNDGDWVYLSSPRGRVEIKIKYFEGTHPKVVHSPHGYWYGVEDGWERLNINKLTDNQTTDPVTASLPLKGLLCRIEKINLI